ncbi:MAG: hypothetical protein VYD54_02780 [Bdellovibrionota bacterium]|nr:hypothetical protein [Bdellovibrionota bacterium]
MKKFLVLLMVLGVSSTSFGKAQGEVKIGSKKIVKSVKNLLKEGSLNASETCLDEYLARHRQLAKMTGFAPLAGVAGTATTTAAGVGTGVVAGASLGGPWGALIGGSIGGVALGGAGAAAYVGYQVYTVTQLIQNRYLMKVISNARDGRGKNLKRFTKSFNRRNKGLNASSSNIADLIVEADMNGTLCDGSIVRKGKKKRLTKIRHYLANKREIIKHLGRSL